MRLEMRIGQDGRIIVDRARTPKTTKTRRRWSSLSLLHIQSSSSSSSSSSSLDISSSLSSATKAASKLATPSASHLLTMDQQAATLLATLKRTSAASDSKLALLNNLKSDIKHHRVPDNAQPVIFDCLKYAISQQSSSTLATGALTTLSHLIKRLKIQDADGAAIVAHAPKLMPALHERLGDLRESHRAGASQVLTELWPFCGHVVENMIRDEAIAGSNARAKDAGMQWVVKVCLSPMTSTSGFLALLTTSVQDAS